MRVHKMREKRCQYTTDSKVKIIKVISVIRIIRVTSKTFSNLISASVFGLSGVGILVVPVLLAGGLLVAIRVVFVEAEMIDFLSRASILGLLGLFVRFVEEDVVGMFNTSESYDDDNLNKT